MKKLTPDQTRKLREALRGLPDRFLNWLTGLPRRPGDDPLFPWRPEHHVWLQFAAVVGAASLGIAAAQNLINGVLYGMPMA